jgi:hypothetical protein
LKDDLVAPVADVGFRVNVHGWPYAGRSGFALFYAFILRQNATHFISLQRIFS